MQYLTQHPPLGGHPTKKGYLCFACLSVVNSCRETPGPIPNPEAKPAHADGTATGRLWESKSPPTPNNKNTTKYRREGDGQPPSPSLFRVLPQQAPHDGSSPHTSSGFRPHGTAHTCRGSGRQRTLNHCFYPRCFVGCDSGDPCGFRMSYSNINTPTKDTCPALGIL